MNPKILTQLLLVALLSVSCGNKKTSETMNNKGIPKVATAADQPMKIIAKLSVKPERAKDFIEAAKDIIAKSNTEAGCLYYQLFQDPYDNTKFVFVEEYKNQAAVDAHFASDYFNAFGPKIGDMIVGTPEIKVITVGKEVIQ